MRRTVHFLALALAVPLLAAAPVAMAGQDAEQEAIALAIDRWITHQTPSGFLPYGFDFLRDEVTEQGVTSAANLTRQAGTSATIADYYLLTKDPRVRPVLEGMLAAFGQRSLPIGKSWVQSAIEEARLLSIPRGRYKLKKSLEWSGLLYEPEGSARVLSPDTDYGKAYAGATALALLTEVRYALATRDDRFAHLRGAWLEGLEVLRIPGDGFRIRPTVIDTAAYYDGEAWLALAEYHRAFPEDDRVQAMLEDLDGDLTEKYLRKYDRSFFHWGMMAASARYADTRDPKFLQFIRDQTLQFLDRMDSDDSDHNKCALIEGAADAMAAMGRAGERDTPLFLRTQAWAQGALQDALGMQIQPEQRAIVFGNATVSAPRLAEFAGSFRLGAYSTETQVDVTAHCVSALVKLARNRALVQ